MSRAFVPVAAVLLALLPACARRAADPAPEAPNVVIVPDDDGTIPPPREMPFAAEPSDVKGAMEVYVVRAGNGTWKVQYPEGQRVVLGGDVKNMTEIERKMIGKLMLPVNKPVKFTLTAEKGTGAMDVPAFPLSVTVGEGRYTHAAVKPTRAGEFDVRDGDARAGTIAVVSVEEFNNWLMGFPGAGAANPVDGSPAHEGRQLFLKLQCVNCHTAKPDAKAPVLEGLWGSKVQLKGGGAEVADEQYIRESIRKPKAKVVEGWEPIMPAYDKAQVTEEELNALVAYVRSLKAGATPMPEEKFPPPVGAPTERMGPKSGGAPANQPRPEPRKIREGGTGAITRPELSGAKSPELHPEDLRTGADKVPAPFSLPVAPPPREKK